MKTSTKFTFENGLSLEVTEEGFSLCDKNNNEILAGVDFDMDLGYIQFADTTKFKIFKDKEISTFQFKKVE